MSRSSIFKGSSFRNAMLGGAALVVIATAGTGAANATVFGGSATFNDMTLGNALTVTAIPGTKMFATSDLQAGTANNSQYFVGFMALLTQDTAGGACLFGCQNTDTIGLTFNWTQPSTAPDSTFGGQVKETTFTIASLDNGSLKWANDTHLDSNGRYAEETVLFADGASAVLDVYDSLILGTTSSEATQFDVRIKDVKDVPEPVSIALLGVGMLGLGVVRRCKPAAQA